MLEIVGMGLVSNLTTVAIFISLRSPALSARAYWCTKESTIWLPNSGAGAICPCEVDGSLVSVGKLDVGNARDKGTFDGTDS